MLLRAGVPAAAAQRVADYITALEAELLAASTAAVAVSEADASHYRQASPQTPVFVVPNGVARPVEPDFAEKALTRDFGDEKYLLFVGSAYPPNIDGFVNLVLKRGLYFRPPVKCLAICGGAAHGILDSTAFQANPGAHQRRVNAYSVISDGGLEALKRGSHAVLLPIQFGGGSNLKTAEALASGKWVVATSKAMRGFTEFSSAPGVIVADTADAFHAAIVHVLAAPPLALDPASAVAREAVYWDRGFETSGYASFMRRRATGPGA
jgi:glycosyltransferase involved in cell wall biosynthesis